MKSFYIEALIVALGLFSLGNSIRIGMGDIQENNRVVNVKGLAEMEVAANKVTWPLNYKMIGNNLTSLYDDMQKKNQTILGFLKEKGIQEDEMSVSAPEIIDLKAERYGNNNDSPFRYNVTSVITVTSEKVELVRNLIREQGELLKRGVAISAGDYRYNVEYEFTKLNDIKPQMIEQATKNARESAEKFAKDSESELGKIRFANQGQFSITDRDANTPHIKKVRVVTSITYSLKD